MLLPWRAAFVLLAALASALAEYTGTDAGLRPRSFRAYARTHLFQLADDPVGTVVFFHGCSRSAFNFFPYDAELCPDCIGFPEHVSHTKQALARGYNVLALNPNDDRVNCWSSSAKQAYGMTFKNDQPDVIATVATFLDDHKLTGLVFLWGASSGGTLALKLPGALQYNAKHGGPWFRVDGIISEVSTPTDFADDGQGGLAVEPYPPVSFVRMERDGDEADAKKDVNFFTQNGVPSGYITSPPRRLEPNYFSDRSADISPSQSQLIVGALRKIGMVDANGWLTADPHDDDDASSRAYGWTTKLRALLPWLTPQSKSLSLILKFSPIQQAMMVAYARHDAVSDWFTACLVWLEGRGQQASLADLAAKYRVPRGDLAALRPTRQVDQGSPSNGGGDGAQANKPQSASSDRPRSSDAAAEQAIAWDNEVAAASATQTPKPKPTTTSWEISW